MPDRRNLRRTALFVLVAFLAACSDNAAGPAPTTVAVAGSPSTSVEDQSTAPAQDPNDTSPNDASPNDASPNDASQNDSTDTGTDDVLPSLDDVTMDEWVPKTRTDELALALASGEPATVQQAVDVFDLVYSDMPGATPSELPAGEGFGTTYALNLIESVRKELAPQQVDALDALDAAVVESAQIGGVQPVEGKPTASGFIRPGGRGAKAPALLAGVMEQYLPIATTVWNDWQAYKPSFPKPVLVLEVMSSASSPGDMDSFPLPADPKKCRVRIFPKMYVPNPSTDNIKTAFAHEVFHCIQFMWGNIDGKPDWMIEGSASFAAFDLYRGVRPPPKDYANLQWFASASEPLAVRTYSAWPLFESFKQYGANPYGAVQQMMQAGSSDTSATLQAGGMNGQWWRSDWTSRTTRSTNFGEPEWSLAWPSPTGAEGPKNNVSPRGARGIGTYTVTGTGEFAQSQPEVTITPDVGILAVVPVHGPMSTHATSATVVIGQARAVRFCFSPDGCVCPDGQTSDTVAMDGRQMIFSFPADETTPSALVKAAKWNPKQQCRKEQPRRATHNGDPHLTTFDGVAYDVMALGEFVMSRDSDGGFEVQARHEPIGIGAGTSAVAVSNGAHRVTFTAPKIEHGATLTVRVDGVALPADAGPDAGPDGISMEATGPDNTGWSLTWDDGTVVDIRWNLGWFVTVTASSERAGRLVGLLGAADDDPRNDLLLPDASPIDPDLDHQSTLDEFARSWLVDDAGSLFDYDQGQSPATFAAAELLSDPPTPTDESVRLCHDSLGERATEHELASCAYDVTATGDDSFVDAYTTAVTDRVADEGDPLTGVGSADPSSDNGTDPATAEAGTPSLVLTGSLYDGIGSVSNPDAVGELAGSIDARSGTVIVSTIALCTPNVNVTFSVTRRDTGAAAQTLLCDPLGLKGALGREGDEAVPGEGYVYLSADGVYDISITSDSASDLYTEVQVFADDKPTVINSGEALTAGWTGSLTATADSVILPITTGDKNATYTVSATDDICIVDLYGADPPGKGNPAPIEFCGHRETLAFTPTFDLVVPVVVFNRTGTAVEVRIERAD